MSDPAQQVNKKLREFTSFKRTRPRRELKADLPLLRHTPEPRARKLRVELMECQPQTSSSRCQGRILHEWKFMG